MLVTVIENHIDLLVASLKDVGYRYDRITIIVMIRISDRKHRLVGNQHPKVVTHVKSSTSRCHQHWCS